MLIWGLQAAMQITSHQCLVATPVYTGAAYTEWEGTIGIQSMIP